MIWGLLFLLFLAVIFIGLNAFYKQTDYFKWQHLELESYNSDYIKNLIIELLTKIENTNDTL